MAEIKTLAKCTPTEFISQTVKIKKSAEKWMKLTDISSIRRRPIEYKTVKEDASAEERAKIIKENADIEYRQGLKNLSDIFDACFEHHPKETLELLALCCFVEPANVDDHPMSFYIEALKSLLNDSSVIDFFTSLRSLAQIHG